MVGVLLEAGADAAVAFGPHCSPVALAIHHGQLDTLRWLFRSGHCHLYDKLRYDICSNITGEPAEEDIWCLAVHVALVPPKASGSQVGHPKLQLGALEVLLHEFGADVNARDVYGQTPLHWLPCAAADDDEVERALGALLSAGAAIEARDDMDITPLLAASSYAPPLVSLLLSLGASPDVIDVCGRSPLIEASELRVGAPDNVPLLLRVSSRATRRAVDEEGKSAVDRLLERKHRHEAQFDMFFYGFDDSDLPWYDEAIDELLLSGANVHPRNAALAIENAARLGVQLEPRAAAQLRAWPPWRRLEAMLGVAFEHQEMRALAEGVTEREKRVRDLERQLLLGGASSGEEEGDGGA